MNEEEKERVRKHITAQRDLSWNTYFAIMKENPALEAFYHRTLVDAYNVALTMIENSKTLPKKPNNNKKNGKGMYQ